MEEPYWHPDDVFDDEFEEEDEEADVEEEYPRDTDDFDYFWLLNWR